MLDEENLPVLTEREVLRNLQAIVTDADSTDRAHVSYPALHPASHLAKSPLLFYRLHAVRLACSRPRTERSGLDFAQCLPATKTIRPALTLSTTLFLSFASTTLRRRTSLIYAAISYVEHTASKVVSRWALARIGGTTRYAGLGRNSWCPELADWLGLSIAPNHCLCRRRCRYQLRTYRSRWSHRSALRGRHLHGRPYASCPVD